MQKENKKIINAWAFYDWANSAYPLVITSTIFPIYYNAVTSSDNSDIISFLGLNFTNTALYSYALSFSYLLISLFSPLLSGIADYSGNKKRFMQFFCYLGAISCSTLFFFNGPNIYLGIGAFILASIGYSGSIVFYNAYLPEITAPKNQDLLSAKGYALGYIGSSLLLLFNLSMILKPEWFNIEDTSFPPRFSFLLVGVWWILFSQVTFYYLPNTDKKNVGENILLKGYRELRKVWRELKHLKHLKLFLVAFFFYNMGVQTVMYLAALFGDKELKLEGRQLIITILIIQFVAIGGAYLFSFFSKRLGNIPAISIAIILWIFICIGAYFVYTAQGFYILAFSVGIIMGGIQSLSRSTYSKLLPHTPDHASYFSFYDICDKLGIVIGTASYGIIEELTGSMRNSIIALIVFFILGLVILFYIKKLNKLANS